MILTLLNSIHPEPVPGRIMFSGFAPDSTLPIRESGCIAMTPFRLDRSVMTASRPISL
jgi:hypothetical protein